MIDDWYYKSSRGSEGPFTTEQVIRSLRSAGIKPSSLVWRPGDANSRYAKDVPEFQWKEISAEHAQQGREQRARAKLATAKSCLGLIVITPLVLIGFSLIRDLWIATLVLIPTITVILLIGVVVMFILEKTAGK